VRSRPEPLRTNSVSQDWRTPLQGDKSHLYLKCIQHLETSYSMFSVNLDEALGMRRTGLTSKARQVLAVAPALCRRLAHPLLGILRTMLDHAKHFGVAPNLEPLDPKNFQSSRSQRAALFNDLVSRIVLTRKLQFAYKISALADLVDELDLSFESTAEELACGDALQPDRAWDLLDAAHYDLNTCLREGIIVLKSFLHALPEAQLPSFQVALNDAYASTGSPCVTRLRHLAHRRMAFLKGQ
jgi:hypothetical protein